MKTISPTLALLWATALSAATIHVDQNSSAASDANSGTKHRPFKSISAGVAGLKAGDTLLVGPGVYRETIRITTSGTADKPILIVAEKKGAVTIRGSALVSGWRRSEANPKIFIHEGWDKYFGKWDESLVKGGDKVPLMRWGNLLAYQNLADLRATEGFEKDGAVFDPQFADWKNLDLRVPADSPLIKMGCYPKGEVPAVKLGVINK